jgi:hypothetical protein
MVWEPSPEPATWWFTSPQRSPTTNQMSNFSCLTCVNAKYTPRGPAAGRRARKPRERQEERRRGKERGTCILIGPGSDSKMAEPQLSHVLPPTSQWWSAADVLYTLHHTCSRAVRWTRTVHVSLLKCTCAVHYTAQLYSLQFTFYSPTAY